MDSYSSQAARQQKARTVASSGFACGLRFLGLHFLLERAVDFVLARPFSFPLPEGIAGEPLFCDHLQVVVGAASPFSKRRRIDLVELADEQWILSRNELMQESPMA